MLPSDVGLGSDTGLVKVRFGLKGSKGEMCKVPYLDI